MKRVYLLEETPKIKRIEREVYQELFHLLKLKKPHAQSLMEDPKLFALCDPLVIFSSGQLKVTHVMADNPSFYLIEVLDEA